MRWLTILLCSLLVFSGCKRGESMTGTGTALDPYIITTRADLEAVNDHLDAYYELGADIDLAGGDWSPIGATGWGTDWAGAYNYFTGVLDGKGHKISNMTIDVSAFTVTDVHTIGLFCFIYGSIDNVGIVRGVNLCSALISFGDIETEECGLLAGALRWGMVEHCSVTGTITKNTDVGSFQIVGGLVGSALHSTIDSCRVDVVIVISGDVSVQWLAYFGSIGGACGILREGSTISNCQVFLSLRGTFYSFEIRDVGGIIGMTSTVSVSPLPIHIESCNVHIDVDITFAREARIFDIGGAVGASSRYSEFIDVSVTGRIRGIGAVSGVVFLTIGGFCGTAGDYPGSVDCTINRCSSSVDLVFEGHQTDLIGGFCGYAFSTGTISNCCAIGDVSLAADATAFYIGGFIGGRSGGMTNCHSVGHITVPAGSTGVGGFCGATEGGTDTSNYWDTETSGYATSAIGTGKTTSQMQTQSTFTDWDFSTVWNIASGTYPFLRIAFVTVTDGCSVVRSFPWVGRFQLSKA
jgi:hypothetical protein